jgi:hypothetical protein
MGLGPSLPPVELARRDLAFFMEVKRLFSTTSEVEIFSKESWIGTKVTGLTGRGLGMTGRIRSVLPACCERAHGHVWSLVGPARPVRRQRDSEREGLIGRGGASGHDRPDASGYEW